jgi:hypothetical protein
VVVRYRKFSTLRRIDGDQHINVAMSVSTSQRALVQNIRVLFLALTDRRHLFMWWPTPPAT